MRILFALLLIMFFTVSPAYSQYSIIFTLEKNGLTSDEEAEVFTRKLAGRHIKVNERNDRSLHEAIVPNLDVVLYFLAYFQHRSPIICYLFNESGLQHGYAYNDAGEVIPDTDSSGDTISPFPTNATEYLDKLPSKLTWVDGELVEERRTVPEQVHKFYGWADKVF